jgi:FKBP-type peptidyl-prolyl cis-trans isomerase FkpA
MRFAFAVLLACAPLSAFAGDAAAPAAGKPEPAKAQAPAKPAAKSAASGALKTDDQKTLYLLGFVLGNRTNPLHITAAESKFVDLGFKDGMNGKKPAVDPEVYGPKINELAMARTKKDRDAAEAKEKEAAQKRKQDEKPFLEKAAAEKDAQKFPSGLIMITEREGKGDMPKPEDTVKVNYEGKFVDGTVFDSSYKRGEPATFPLNGVIKCWTEGVSKMKVGGKAKLICPSDIAYGDAGRGEGMPGGATLVFEVELLEIVKAK